MGVIGNHYVITMRSHAVTNDQSIQNVFCYEVIDGTPTAEFLGDYFKANVLPTIQAILSNGTIIDDFYVVNLEVPSDFATVTSGDDGDIGGDSMPTFVAFEFEYVRTDRTINNGRKAFALVPEDSVVGGVVTPTVRALCNTLADQLAADLVDVGIGASYRPKIWRRPGVYAAGAVAAPGSFFPVADVKFNRISSQNTRKTGRGS